MRYHILILLVFLCSEITSLGTASILSASGFLFDRNQIEQSLEAGKVSIYDIPFATYVSLGMWKEIDEILDANVRNIVKYPLPGRHYSRPFQLDHDIWVFGDAGREGNDTHVFDPESMTLKRVIKNDLFIRHRGGVRAVFGNWVLVSGSGRETDLAAFWNVRTDRRRTLKLPERLFIGTVTAFEDHLYIGGCGGIVRILKSDAEFNLDEFYRTPFTESSAGSGYAEECIQGIAEVHGRLIGIGENGIFTWNPESGAPPEVLEKSITGSAVHIQNPYLVEFLDDRFSVRNLETGTVIGDRSIGAPISDAKITSDRVLPEQKGDILIMSLAHGQGFLFYDTETLTRLSHVLLKGGPFTVEKGRLFVTGNDAVYRYDLRSMRPFAFERFLKTVNLAEIPMTEGVYFQLLKRARRFPRIFPLNELSTLFLKTRGITLRHSVESGSGGDAEPASRHAVRNGTEGVARHVVEYEITNRSEKPISMTLMFQWDYPKGSEPAVSTGNSAGVAWRRLDLPARGGKAFGRVDLDDERPERVYVFPIRIRIMAAEG